MNPLSLAQAVLFVIPLALSLVVQAFARAQVADWLGDDTPRREGRLTLNPAVHVDPLGTFALPMALFLLQGAGGMLPLLGWAKPVNVHVERMRRRFDIRTLEMLVAIASPLASVVMALGSAVVLVRLGQEAPGSEAAQALCGQLFFMNVALALFQLLPIGPLAGFSILLRLLPHRFTSTAAAFNDTWGQWLLLALLMFGRGLLVAPTRFVAGTFLAMVGG